MGGHFDPRMTKIGQVEAKISETESGAKAREAKKCTVENDAIARGDSGQKTPRDSP